MRNINEPSYLSYGNPTQNGRNNAKTIYYNYETNTRPAVVCYGVCAPLPAFAEGKAIIDFACSVWNVLSNQFLSEATHTDLTREHIDYMSPAVYIKLSCSCAEDPRYQDV